MSRATPKASKDVQANELIFALARERDDPLVMLIAALNLAELHGGDARARQYLVEAQRLSDGLRIGSGCSDSRLGRMQFRLALLWATQGDWVAYRKTLEAAQQCLGAPGSSELARIVADMIDEYDEDWDDE